MNLPYARGMNLRQNRRGQTLTEYMVLLILMSLAVVGTTQTLGKAIKKKMDDARERIRGRGHFRECGWPLKRSGQILTELLIALPLGFLLFAMSWQIFWAAWSRLECAYGVFRQTHTALFGWPTPPTKVRIQMLSDRIRGEAACRGIWERVDLPYLETARW